VAGTDLQYTYLAKGRYWRFRHKLTGDVALPNKRGLHYSLQPKEPGFMTRYTELLEVVERRATIKPAARDTFAWLVEEYRRSAEFKELADATQLDYGRTLDLIRDELGSVRYALASRNVLKAVRDGHAKTVRKAHKIKQMLSRLYSWADENDLVEAGFNPAKSIKRLKRKGGDREIVVWSDAEVEMFLDGLPLHIKTPVLVALYTGQRREDVVRMTWKQFQGDVVRVRQSKTTALLDIACHKVLRAHLESVKRPGVVICTTAEGKAYTANGLSGTLRRAVAAKEGMPANRSMHGLRYAAGSRMEEAGCTVAEIESVLGHQTFKMALKYASQRLRAKAAMAKMEAADAA
jgi:integrase